MRNAVVWAAAIAAACHRGPPSPRERVLARVPGAAQVVAAADGSALADPAVRRAIDAVRPALAPSLGCVVDAALASDAVAFAASRTTGAAIVIATPSTDPHCPALSRLEDGLYLATIGDATAVPGREMSPLESSRWARARDYLESAPLAVALDLDGMHAVAAATVHPFDAWLAIDAEPGALAHLEAAERALIARWTAGSLAAPANKLAASRADGQLVVRATHLEPEELVALAPALAAALDPPPGPPAVPKLDCPPDITRCIDPTHYEVISVAPHLQGLASTATPVVSAGSVIGIRLTADAPWLLRRGDILLGIDGTPIRSLAELTELASRPRRQAAVAFRRGGADFVVHLAGANE